MLVIFQFDSAEIAVEQFTAVNKTLSDADVKFSGFLNYPKNYGTEMTSSYFVIVSTVNFDLPKALMEFEYDYSYPVAADISISE